MGPSENHWKKVYQKNPNMGLQAILIETWEYLNNPKWTWFFCQLRSALGVKNSLWVGQDDLAVLVQHNCDDIYLYSLCFCISFLYFGRLVCTICCSAPFAIMNHSKAFYRFCFPSFFFFLSKYHIIFSQKTTKISSNPFRFDWLESPILNYYSTID